MHDRLILEAWHSTLGTASAKAGELSRAERQIRLPVKLGGCGLTSQARIADAACVGCSAPQHTPGVAGAILKPSQLEAQACDAHTRPSHAHQCDSEATSCPHAAQPPSESGPLHGGRSTAPSIDLTRRVLEDCQED